MFIQADSLHDFGISIQAKAIYQLSIGIKGHVYKAITEELIDRGSYRPYPARYYDCRSDTYKIPSNLRDKLQGCQVVWADSAFFLKDTGYETFCVAVAFFDPDNNTRVNDWQGFFSQHGFNALSTIIVYCPTVRADNNSKFSRQNFETADLMKRSLGVHAVNLKSTFVHEFSHNYNYLQWRDRARQINKVRPGSKQHVPVVRYNSPPAEYETKQDRDQHVKYVNDPQEVNSAYMEWIIAIQQSFKYPLKIKSNYDIKRVFATFHDFWDFYWTNGDDYVPENLKDYANEQTIKKLARRLYGYYQFLCKNPEIDAQDAENFTRDQMRFDYLKDHDPLKGWGL